MIDVKQAVANAKAFAAQTLGVNELLLEEVSSDQSQSHITLSFPDRLGDDHLRGQFGDNWHLNREFKIFDVEKGSGEIAGMAIRALPSVT